MTIENMMEVGRRSPFASPFTVVRCESKNDGQVVPQRQIALANAVGKTIEDEYDKS